MSYPPSAISKAEIYFDYAERKFIAEIDYKHHFESGDYWVQIMDVSGQVVYLQLKILAPRTVSQIIEKRGTRRGIGDKVFLARDVTPKKNLL